jgi:hypothetical protein
MKEHWLYVPTAGTLIPINAMQVILTGRGRHQSPVRTDHFQAGRIFV